MKQAGIKSKQEREGEEINQKDNERALYRKIARIGRRALKSGDLAIYRKEYQMTERAIIDSMIDCTIIDTQERLSFYDRNFGILYGFKKLLHDVDQDAAKKPSKE